MLLKCKMLNANMFAATTRACHLFGIKPLGNAYFTTMKILLFFISTSNKAFD